MEYDDIVEFELVDGVRSELREYRVDPRRLRIDGVLRDIREGSLGSVSLRTSLS